MKLSTTSESALIGTILYRPATLDECGELTPFDFLDQELGRVFEALTLARSGGFLAGDLGHMLALLIAAIGGGIIVKEYLNKFAMDGNTVLKIRLHPNMPPGTILFTTDRLPYPLSNVTNILQMRMRRDYYQIEWPLVTRKYQYGVYEDGVLQNYFPPSQGILTNIGNG